MFGLNEMPVSLTNQEAEAVRNECSSLQPTRCLQVIWTMFAFTVFIMQNVKTLAFNSS